MTVFHSCVRPYAGCYGVWGKKERRDVTGGLCSGSSTVKHVTRMYQSAVRGEQSKHNKVEPTVLFVKYMRNFLENGLRCKLS
jgi:hypothetical protein